MTAFDDELAVEAWEGRLAPLLDQHGAAVIAALRTGAPRPPWPDALRTPALARLAAPHDPAWAARARTLARWSLAARLEATPVMIAARRTPATAAGLAARHAALRTAAASLGHPDAGALVDALYGARPSAAPADDDATDGPAPSIPALPLPTWVEVRAALAAHAGVDPRAVAVIDDAHAAATVLTTAGAVCAFPPVTDLGSLTVAAHELGHGVYAAAMRGLPLGLAAAPSRRFDEAVAAWAVRALEEVLPPAWAVVAAWRRQRGVRARARLAQCEHAALVLGDADAWARAVGPWRPALAQALLDEPGVAATYAAADRRALTPGPGQIAAWGQAGAALSVAGLA
ncbi:MAG: hypothetical protein JNK64_04840 [Myxococcales bacterium]|nr:hypothetical protein [Myxococcales bacterium]